MRPFCARPARASERRAKAHIKGGAACQRASGIKSVAARTVKDKLSSCLWLSVRWWQRTLFSDCSLLCMTYSVQENYNFIVNFLLFLLSGWADKKLPPTPVVALRRQRSSSSWPTGGCCYCIYVPILRVDIAPALYSDARVTRGYELRLHKNECRLIFIFIAAAALSPVYAARAPQFAPWIGNSLHFF